MTDALHLVANADGIVSALEWNARLYRESRTHVFRVERPLQGRREATLTTTEPGRRFANPATSPVLLAPEQFVADDAPDAVAHPDKAQVHDAAKEVAGVESIDDVDDDTLNECWDVALEEWESAVRANLVESLDVLERVQHADEERVADVRYTNR